ncbi:hypothetical protein DU002_04720 [Corallincola holothuriorum]|uniref:DUF3592 domain-containing protein n=1 Tax=Corallincola holothuriorum TaxID=2282215 RepID=A0A368NNN5_9GAMM|nr:hypothetical protein [Corallincola holothuriorum]RCU51776.1 hypothetical protein DU002_04720 [Corallincola holothuriorum]
MAYYCIIVGGLLIAWAVALFTWRVLFYVRGQRLQGLVIDKVLRNFSPETRGGKSRHLKIEYVDPQQGKKLYVCDNSLLTGLYRTGDGVMLVVAGNRVMLASWLSVATPPMALLLLGSVTFYIGWSGY